LEKFATAHRLRWLWLEWKDNTKIWADTGNPCNDHDMEIFYAASTISLGNGRKTPFWHAPWLNGLMPKDIAPKKLQICKRKNWSVAQALHEDEWIRKLAIDATASINHLTQFVQLWANIQRVHLPVDVEDDITWNSPAMGNIRRLPHISCNLFGLVESSLNKIVWKAWATPNAKNYAWLALQYRLWTADRLRRWGWDNCGPCQLCNQTEENHDHLFVHYRFTTRIWELLKDWLGLQGTFPRLWAESGGPPWRKVRAPIERGWLH
jgi:hypothetical protein